MYSDQIYLTTQDILEKQFKIDARGYRPQEVDKYLDLVIRDYTGFNAIIKDQERKMKEMFEELSRLKQENRMLKEQLEEKTSNESSATKTLNNIDLLKRISQLEKVVFGKEE